MRPSEEIKQLLKNAKIRINPEVKKAALTELINELESAKNIGPTETRPVLWRIIMKSNITKFAATTVIIGLVVIGSTLIEKTATPAYAVEQTIKAMQNVTTVHCFINLFDGERMEVWSKINPETGENEYFHMSMPGMIMVSTPEETYRYNQIDNVVIHLKGDGHVVSDIRFGRFIEDMVELAESLNGIIEFEGTTVEGKPVILVTIETDNGLLESIVDPDTKLPISMNFKPKGDLQPGQLGQSMEDFSFNEPLPEGIFDFEIPEGAQVIEQ